MLICPVARCRGRIANNLGTIVLTEWTPNNDIDLSVSGAPSMATRVTPLGARAKVTGVVIYAGKVNYKAQYGVRVRSLCQTCDFKYMV